MNEMQADLAADSQAYEEWSIRLELEDRAREELEFAGLPAGREYLQERC